MRSVSVLKFAVGAAILAASTASAMAGGWGHGGWGYGGALGYGGGWGYGSGCGCGGCGCAAPAAVAVATYTPYTVYQPMTVYRPRTAYVASVSYATVPYEQAYVVEQGPYYRPAVTGYRTASYTYDEPRVHPYVGYGVRRHGWRGYDRWHRRGVTHYRGQRVIRRPMPAIGYK